uniref:Uncharacterized protein n=1 Tax=Chelydra serpentina TaxID=8475 RepID=A0A8C3STP9_CHESE
MVQENIRIVTGLTQMRPLPSGRSLSTGDNERLQEQGRQFNTENALPAMPLPQWFGRKSWQFCGSMNQCHLLFLMCPPIYASDQAKVALVISLLIGDALDEDWVAFLESMSTIFDDCAECEPPKLP